MVTGTFYLLAVGIAFAFGGIAALAGRVACRCNCSPPACSRSSGRCWRTAGGRRRASRPGSRGLDIGQSVRVETWNADGTARVDYRGTQWNGEVASPRHAATPHDVHCRDARLDARARRRAALTRGP